MGRGYVKQRPERPSEQASEARVQAMNEKLAARVNRVAQTSLTLPLEAAQSPKEKAEVKLEWGEPVDEARKTKCGRYSCCRVTTNGKRTYELWKLAAGGGWFVCLNRGLDNFLQAKELARQDANR